MREELYQKRRRKARIKLIILFFLLLFELSTATVFAAGNGCGSGGTGKPVPYGSGSSAISDILNDPALCGSSTFKNSISGYLSKPMQFIITLAGVMIVWFTFMKFIFTLLYLTFPAVFDRIDAHQKMSLSIDLKNARPVDIISYIFALIMPNIKSLTDYANGEGDMNVDPWSYIKKKAPMIIIFIIIGCMIYDGAGRDFIAKAADVGLFIENRVNGHDTIGMITRYLDAGQDYKFFYDTNTNRGRNDDKIANEVYKQIKNVNPDAISTAYRQAAGAVAASIVPDVEAVFSTVSGAQSANGTADSFTIGQTRSFSINVSVASQQAPTNNVPGIIQRQVTDPEVMANIAGQRWIIITVSNLVKDETAAADIGSQTPGFGDGYYPNANAWNFSANQITVDLGAVNAKIKNPSTNGGIQLPVQVTLSGETTSTTFTTARINLTSDNKIIIIIPTNDPSGKTFSGQTPKYVSFALGGNLQVEPSDSTKGDQLQYSTSRQFTYGTK